MIHVLHTFNFSVNWRNVPCTRRRTRKKDNRNHLMLSYICRLCRCEIDRQLLQQEQVLFVKMFRYAIGVDYMFDALNSDKWRQCGPMTSNKTTRATRKSSAVGDDMSASCSSGCKILSDPHEIKSQIKKNCGRDKRERADNMQESNHRREQFEWCMVMCAGRAANAHEESVDTHPNREIYELLDLRWHIFILFFVVVELFIVDWIGGWSMLTEMCSLLSNSIKHDVSVWSRNLNSKKDIFIDECVELKLTQHIECFWIFGCSNWLNEVAGFEFSFPRVLIFWSTSYIDAQVSPLSNCAGGWPGLPHQQTNVVLRPCISISLWTAIVTCIACIKSEQASIHLMKCLRVVKFSLMFVATFPCILGIEYVNLLCAR